MKIEVNIEGETHQIEVTRKNGKFFYRMGKDEGEFELKELAPGELSFLSEDLSFPFHFARKNGGSYLLSIDNCTWDASVIDSRTKILKKSGGGALNVVEVVAPMPGKVVRVEVKQGKKVRRDQVLVVIEAMKMENLIKSPRGGVIEEVLVKEGDSVDAKGVLVRFKNG